MLKDGETLEELYEENLKIIQNRNLYRFTSDSVLLTRFVKAKKNEIVADFCAGSGIVGLHFYALNRAVVRSVTLFELQEELSDMSARTVQLNKLENFETVCGRIQDIGNEYEGKFSLILCNPPYEKGGFENEDYKKAICRKEITITLAEIVDVAFHKLKFGGRLAMVHRADRLAEVLYCMKAHQIEPKRLQFVRGKEGAKPYLILVEGTKGAKENIEILPDKIAEQRSCF